MSNKETNLKKIVITSGPVNGKLDDVKLITNKFKGGRIAALADKFINYEIIFITTKGSVLPKNENNNITIVYHEDIYDYMDKVLYHIKDATACILGAAVANLIPKETIKGKFPSHNYKEGDIIPIEFIIAPRIVDRIKNVNPNIHLFPFKLLSNVSHNELIDAAYKIVLESHADFVIANDTNKLEDKFIITKEKSVIPIKEESLHEFIIDNIENEFYKTETIDIDETQFIDFSEKLILFKTLINQFEKNFVKTNDFIFGTIAVKLDETSFLTTIRGKNDLNDYSIIKFIDDKKRIVYTNKKATLNSPLLNNIFKNNKNIEYIIHTHFFNENYSTYKYEQPGTIKDSVRNIKGNFNIEYHGSFELY